jgi:hypothetical protein
VLSALSASSAAGREDASSQQQRSARTRCSIVSQPHRAAAGRAPRARAAAAAAARAPRARAAAAAAAAARARARRGGLAR